MTAVLTDVQEKDERLAVLSMLEGRQITADQAAQLLDAIEPAQEIENILPDATIEEEAWMLTALLQVTEAISSPNAAQESLLDMLERVVRVVPLLAGVDRCSVLLWDGAGPTFRSFITYPHSAQPHSPAIDFTAVDRLRGDGQPVVREDERSAYAMLPMTTQGKFLGIMHVEYSNGAHAFSSKETAILTNIACQAAVGIENVYLREEAEQRAALERELQLAHRVQSSLLPATAPELAGWQIASHWQAARSIGGDFYDFIPLGRNRLGLVIADVSGKGMPAALFMALALSFLRACATRSAGVAHALRRANTLIRANTRDGTFVTLFYGIIDAADGVLRYANAGHNPPLHFSSDGIAPLPGHGRALGLSGSLGVTESQVSIQVGDLLVLYTDGLTEAVNEHMEEFGLQRLIDTVQTNLNSSPETIIERIMAAVATFVGAQSAYDDATVVIARRVT